MSGSQEGEAGTEVAETRRKKGMAEPTFCCWKKRCGGWACWRSGGRYGPDTLNDRYPDPPYLTKMQP